MRTPLTALTLQIQLAERAQSEQERTVALERMEQGVKRATRLVQQLLIMARLEPEAAVRDAEPINIAALAIVVASELQPLAAEKSITLEVDAPLPAWILGQEDALRILLRNLIDNAIRYSTPAGRVDVSVRTSGTDVQLTLQDNGPGIPEDERERVFDRFYRGRNAEVGGSGLGLAIVRQIAQMHGATVTLSAGDAPTGLRAVATFPAAEAPIP